MEIAADKHDWRGRAANGKGDLESEDLGDPGFYAIEGPPPNDRSDFRSSSIMRTRPIANLRSSNGSSGWRACIIKVCRL